jgi:hypothetical protein
LELVKFQGGWEVIIIHNISEVYSKTGLQEYEVKINNEFICKFKHKASDGLAKCLELAGLAVERAEKERKGKIANDVLVVLKT